ncbi:MAG TPA: hypothetical protein VNB22_04260, partial [Pyrinomonadaceae bacterium]|nr:hypothetical protein [Pyrinomonadaceae bacterium]
MLLSFEVIAVKAEYNVKFGGLKVCKSELTEGRLSKYKTLRNLYLAKSPGALVYKLWETDSKLIGGLITATNRCRDRP